MASQYFLQLANYLRIPVVAWNADNSAFEQVRELFSCFRGDFSTGLSAFGAHKRCSSKSALFCQQVREPKIVFIPLIIFIAASLKTGLAPQRIKHRTELHCLLQCSTTTYLTSAATEQSIFVSYSEGKGGKRTLLVVYRSESNFLLYGRNQITGLFSSSIPES